MDSVFILIPISIVLAFVIGYFFWWSGHNGQFDDLEGPAHRILMDDDSRCSAPNSSARSTTTCSKSRWPP